jgi:hypothetical protein
MEQGFDNGTVRAILLNRPGVPSPERANRSMNSTLNGWRLRKTWVPGAVIMFLNQNHGDVMD